MNREDINLYPSDLVAIRKRIAWSAADDPGKAISINGIFVLENSLDERLYVATDGYRLTLWGSELLQSTKLSYLRTEQYQSWRRYWIPQVALQSISYWNRRSSFSHLVVEELDESLRSVCKIWHSYGCSSFEICEIDYLPFDQIIPNRYPRATTSVPVKDLRKALKGLSGYEAVRLVPDHSGIRLVGAKPTSEDCTIDPPVIPVAGVSCCEGDVREAASIAYLDQYLRSIPHGKKENPQVFISFWETLDPIVLQTVDTYQVLMPMRV